MIKSLSLIIPAYNPTDGWEDVFLRRYKEFCTAIPEQIPVVLVNDGSSKDISEGVRLLQRELKDNFHYVTYPDNRGKGGALKAGAVSVDSELFMFTDIDFPYSTESMVDVYQAIQAEQGIVTGYRQETYYTDLSNFRTLVSKALRWFNGAISGLPTNDTQCGLKAFDRTSKAILLSCKTDRFLIDLELLLAANNKKINIKPVLVHLRDNIVFTKFDATVLLKEVFSFLGLIIKYRIFRAK
ncbi:MAG: glycosyltransferase [Saprospiraceae bacterium]|nr:glycosyltransferase [Saprospiraceae bacterium]